MKSIEYRVYDRKKRNISKTTFGISDWVWKTMLRDTDTPEIRQEITDALITPLVGRFSTMLISALFSTGVSYQKLHDLNAFLDQQIEEMEEQARSAIDQPATTDLILSADIFSPSLLKTMVVSLNFPNAMAQELLSLDTEGVRMNVAIKIQPVLAAFGHAIIGLMQLGGSDACGYMEKFIEAIGKFLKDVSQEIDDAGAPQPSFPQ